MHARPPSDCHIIALHGSAGSHTGDNPFKAEERVTPLQRLHSKVQAETGVDSPMTPSKAATPPAQPQGQPLGSASTAGQLALQITPEGEKPAVDSRPAHSLVMLELGKPQPQSSPETPEGQLFMISPQSTSAESTPAQKALLVTPPPVADSIQIAPEAQEWAGRMSRLLGYPMKRPFSMEILACNEGSLAIFKSAQRCSLPCKALSNAALAQSSPTLLALYNVDDGKLHGVWVVETNFEHAPKDSVSKMYPASSADGAIPIQ